METMTELQSNKEELRKWLEDKKELKEIYT